MLIKGEKEGLFVSSAELFKTKSECCSAEPGPAQHYLFVSGSPTPPPPSHPPLSLSDRQTDKEIAFHHGSLHPPHVQSVVATDRLSAQLHPIGKRYISLLLSHMGTTGRRVSNVTHKHTSPCIYLFIYSYQIPNSQTLP